jgi:Amino acid permease
MDRQQPVDLFGHLLWRGACGINLGIVKVAVHHPAGSTGFRWSWLNPLSLHGYGGLAAGVVLGLFPFWGWDTAVNLNEESKNASNTPGRAVIISMFFLDFIFVLNIVAAQMLLPEKQLANQGANPLFYFSQQVGGQALGYLMIFAVLVSTVADAQTTLLPVSRLTLSMSRDQVFPHVFSEIETKNQTPLVGTLIIAGLALLGIIVRTASPTVNAAYGNVINDIGVLVAVYYGATGIACAWAYRKVMFQALASSSPRFSCLSWPGCSASGLATRSSSSRGWPPRPTFWWSWPSASRWSGWRAAGAKATSSDDGPSHMSPSQLIRHLVVKRANQAKASFAQVLSELRWGRSAGTCEQRMRTLALRQGESDSPVDERPLFPRVEQHQMKGLDLAVSPDGCRRAASGGAGAGDLLSRRDANLA